MKIDSLNFLKINNLPSGSGIVKSGEIYYVIGDDSPYLFALDRNFNLISKTKLLEADQPNEERIPKAEKPDFESLEMISENELIVFGSGSKSPQRDVFIHIFLNDPLHIKKYNISKFYDHLRALPEFTDSELNIEATAFRDNDLFLFNRKKNLIIRFKFEEFLHFIKGKSAFPKPEIKTFTLPKINGIEAGFSGATALKNEAKLIFTASVEDTKNAYDDGEILGSFIGMIDVSADHIPELFQYCEIPGSAEKLKVESVSADEEICTGTTKVVLITDDDKGNSIIITGLLSS